MSPPAPAPASSSFRLGLTGGIGSGKSTVAALLAEHGATVIDTDALSRATTAPGGAALGPIAATFGAHLINAQGALDRAAMRALVYDDAAARRRLEAIIHPLVLQAADQQSREAEAAGARCIVFDVPLLVESGRRWRDRVTQVLVVDCPVPTQIARVMARSGLTQAEAERIIAAQASRAQRLAAADVVIDNGEGVTLDDLRQTVASLAPRFGL
ncbi:MAG: dephospho-CoA kinase [Comamonadaceae bacterium]|nr:dephospho-CoA kinase [Comamonadaceae bacterium]RRD56847.1 dephospho-CoA kinase [Comamonadaceae bacterium OH2545_COT-014]